MADLLSGRNCILRVYFNGNLWTLAPKSFSVEEVAVEVEDGVNGEQRDRLQKITKYFRTTFDFYEDGSSQTLVNIIASQANDDSYLPQLPLSQGVLFKNQDGSKQAFTLKNSTMGPMKFTAPGRTERFLHTQAIRSQYFAQVAAA